MLCSMPAVYTFCQPLSVDWHARCSGTDRLANGDRARWCDTGRPHAVHRGEKKAFVDQLQVALGLNLVGWFDGTTGGRVRVRLCRLPWLETLPMRPQPGRLSPVSDRM